MIVNLHGCQTPYVLTCVDANLLEYQHIYLHVNLFLCKSAMVVNLAAFEHIYSYVNLHENLKNAY